MVLLAMRRPCPLRLVSALGTLALLGTSPACKPDPVPPGPASIVPSTATQHATPTRPLGMQVEILMAGRPPHRSLALVDVVSGDDTHPLSITSTGYGADGEVRRNLRGTIRNSTTLGPPLLYTIDVEAPDTPAIPTVQITGDPWGPTEAFERFSESDALEPVLRSLLVPVPEDGVGEGAVYRVDVPFSASGQSGQQSTGLVVRTTAELLETFSDGYLLKTDTVLHDAQATGPQRVEGKAEAASPGALRRSEFVMTSRQWRHYDRLLPAKAYGQFRYTDRRQDPPTTLIVDWSIDGGAPPPEAP